MTRSTRSRCLLVIVLLVALTGTFGMTNAPVAEAAACCEACDGLYQKCLSGRGYGCNGDPLCCAIALDPCFTNCIYC